MVSFKIQSVTSINSLSQSRVSTCKRLSALRQSLEGRSVLAAFCISTDKSQPRLHACRINSYKLSSNKLHQSFGGFTHVNYRIKSCRHNRRACHYPPFIYPHTSSFLPHAPSSWTTTSTSGCKPATLLKATAPCHSSDKPMTAPTYWL